MSGYGYKCGDCKHYSDFNGCNNLGEYGRKARGNHPACAFVQPKEEKKKINMKDAILGFVALFVIVPIWLVIAIPAFLVYWLNNAFQWLFRLLSCGLLMCLNGFDGKKTMEYINKVKKEI